MSGAAQQAAVANEDKLQDVSSTLMNYSRIADAVSSHADDFGYNSTNLDPQTLPQVTYNTLQFHQNQQSNRTMAQGTDYNHPALRPLAQSYANATRHLPFSSSNMAGNASLATSSIREDSISDTSSSRTNGKVVASVPSGSQGDRKDMSRLTSEENSKGAQVVTDCSERKWRTFPNFGRLFCLFIHSFNSLTRVMQPFFTTASSTGSSSSDNASDGHANSSENDSSSDRASSDGGGHDIEIAGN